MGLLILAAAAGCGGDSPSAECEQLKADWVAALDEADQSRDDFDRFSAATEEAVELEARYGEEC